MHKLKFTLKQHTPLIHFQHDQAGAILRATEVKPKLDQFLIRKYGGIEVITDTHPDWLIGDGQNPSLDYKLRIIPVSNPISKPIVYTSTNDGKFRPNFPCIFGNIRDGEQKVFRICAEQKIEIISFNNSLRDIIHQEIKNFFFENSYGFRQSKGFGSFFIGDFPGDLLYSNLYFTNNRKPNDYENLFLEIDLFYRCLKSGLNLKIKNNSGIIIDKLYFKSLMFKFAKSQNPKEQWDKRTMRHALYSDDWKYKNDIKQTGVFYDRKDPNGTVKFNASKPSERNYYDFRDLMGLSTEQDWLFYHDKKITKTVHKVIQTNGVEDSFDIERFQSPIRFKPYYNINEKRWFVFIITSAIPELYLGATVNAANKSKSVPLTVYPTFNINDYLEFAINDFDTEDIEYGDGFSEDNVNEAKIIGNIFSQLKTQIHS
jgi:hypothetical protein